MAAHKSKYLKDRLSVPIETDTAFAHIRYATVGDVVYKNSHPYTHRDRLGRRWTLIHNGTIFDFPELLRYRGVQMGDTDSERILLYIVDEMDREACEKGAELTASERFDVLDRLMYRMSEGNKLNLLVYDGELMYAHYNSEGSLHFRKGDGDIIITTQPLSVGTWEEFPFTKLMAFSKGKVVFEGTEHGHRYIEDKESVDQMNLTYSGL